MEEKCLACNATKEKFVYDANACEVVCSACGLVVEQYDGLVQASDFEESEAKLNRTYGLGNPIDDASFLKFLRRRKARLLVSMTCKG